MNVSISFLLYRLMQRFLDVIGDFAGRTWISVKAWIYFSSNYRIRHQTLEYHFLWNQKTDIMNDFWKMWSASNARAGISGCLYQHYLFCSAVHIHKFHFYWFCTICWMGTFYNSIPDKQLPHKWINKILLYSNTYCCRQQQENATELHQLQS